MYKLQAHTMMYGTVNRVAKECINELLQSHADAIRHEEFFPTTFLKTLFFLQILSTLLQNRM